LIVTGTPIAHLPYDEIHYWSELISIFDWATTHVYRSLFLCWGAFAALHHYHNVPRHRMKQKLSGIYPHNVLKPFAPLTAGFDDILNVPVSRYSEIRTEDLKPYPHLELLVASDKAGIFLVEDTLNRRTYILNHLEYDATSLQKEYERDLETNKNPLIPYNYFPDNDPTRTPQITWRAHRTLLFSNWINMIYQGSPYNLSDLNRL
jgi:homoserine O-succinyltransferase